MTVRTRTKIAFLRKFLVADTPIIGRFT